MSTPPDAVPDDFETLKSAFLAERAARRQAEAGTSVVIKIAGTTHWLWRAVDQHGIVLDVLVQSWRDAKAAKRLLRKLLKRQGRAPPAQGAEQPGRKLAPAH